MGKPDVISPHDGNYNVGKYDLSIRVLVILNLVNQFEVFFGNIEEEYSRFSLLLVGHLPKFIAELASLIGKIDSIGISCESENLGDLLLSLGGDSLSLERSSSLQLGNSHLDVL